jgi:hypothetical protein
MFSSFFVFFSSFFVDFKIDQFVTLPPAFKSLSREVKSDMELTAHLTEAWFRDTSISSLMLIKLYMVSIVSLAYFPNKNFVDKTLKLIIEASCVIRQLVLISNNFHHIFRLISGFILHHPYLVCERLPETLNFIFLKLQY